MKTLSAALAFGLAGCAHPLYWSKPDTGMQQTAADLSACRVQANAGGGKVFSAKEMETPCMVAKGYALGKVPPR